MDLGGSPKHCPHPVTIFSRSLGSRVSQDLTWVSNISPAEIELPVPVQEVQPASSVCSLHVHCHPVWLSHQTRPEQSTADSQDSRKDHRCQTAHHPGLVHLQSQEVPLQTPGHHLFQLLPLLGTTEHRTPKQTKHNNCFLPPAVTLMTS